jgi:dUTPase
MEIEIKNVESLILPQSAQESDTGYDIIAATDPIIVGERAGEGVDLWKRVDYIEYKTNLFIAPPKGEEINTRHDFDDNLFSEIIHNKYGYTLIYPRSSISKYNLILKNSVGIADYSYRGNLCLRFAYQWQPEDQIYFNYSDGGVYSYGRVNTDKIYKKGDKCGQLVAAWKEGIEWKVVDKLEETEWNEGGFGSSGGNSV